MMYFLVFGVVIAAVPKTEILHNLERRCKEKCNPAKKLQRVCATNGESYASECEFTRKFCHTNNTPVEVAVAYTGSCTCPRQCSRHKKTICGTDGRTYLNYCHLQQSNCYQDTKIRISHGGRCPEDISQPSFDTCSKLCDKITEISPICATQGIEFGNDCYLHQYNCLHGNRIEKLYNGKCVDKCPIPSCSLYYNPICASDGNIYPNKCIMTGANCHLRNAPAPLTKKPATFCNKKKEKPECPSMCPILANPVCGSNGKTYGNECYLHFSNCFEKNQVELSYVGKCIKKHRCPLCSDDQQSKRVCVQFGEEFKTLKSNCHLHRYNCLHHNKFKLYNEGSCSCPSDCDHVHHSPVCASNGVTFKSMCKLRKEQCTSSLWKSVKFLYDGACRCQDFQERPRAIRAEPICGKNKDGRIQTMLSERHMANINCQYNQFYVNVAFGGCPSDVSIIESSGFYDEQEFEGSAAQTLEEFATVDVHLVQPFSESNLNCPTSCPSAFKPVCASDQLTYHNNCIFLMVKCNALGHLQKLYDTVCHHK